MAPNTRLAMKNFDEYDLGTLYGLLGLKNTSPWFNRFGLFESKRPDWWLRKGYSHKIGNWTSI
jgi:hypothetical protein